MAKNVYHVVPHEDEWGVKKEGNERTSSNHATQQEAIHAARENAKEGDDLVIHRSDGTIRERINYHGSNGNGSSESTKGKEVKTEDVLSVGTRVSWSAIFAGSFVGFAIYISTMLLALAIGVTTVEKVEPGAFATGAKICGMFCLLVALFMAGFVASRTTVGENKTESLIYGVVVWAVFMGMLVFLGAGAGFGLGAELKNLGPNEGNAEQRFIQRLENEGYIAAEKKEQFTKVKEEFGDDAKNMSVTSAAWWSFLGLMLSLLTAVGGAITGAGPELVLKQLRDRRLVVNKA